jgi:outer membrane protein TolC
MGDDVRGALPTVDEELVFASVQLDVENETRRALEERADLKLARLLVRAAHEDERLAAAAYYPEIHAQISGTYIPVTDIRRGSQGSARRSDDIVSSELRMGGGYTWRVIDNGRVGGARARQRAIREANQAVLARLEAEVPRELTRLQNNLDALQAQHEALLKASSVAEQTVNAVQSQVMQGLASQLEYRSAETDFLQTKAGLLSVAYQQNVALAERDRVTGRYFRFEAP